MEDLIQTDATINEGNSGGPIFNMYGEVIGIVSAKYASSTIEGLGFCIPINDVSNIITDLIDYGKVRNKAYMGISVTDIDDKIIKKAEAEGVDESVISERYIKSILETYKLLNCLPHYKNPKVTENMDNIINFIDLLVKKQGAYVADKDVYFDVTKDADYGVLSGQTVENLISGSRVEENDKKHQEKMRVDKKYREDYLKEKENVIGVVVDDKGIADGVEKIYDAFVSVNVIKNKSNQGVGSGFIFSKDGYIITNHHVIDNASSVKVKFTNDEIEELIVPALTISKVNVTEATPITVSDSGIIVTDNKGNLKLLSKETLE